MTFVNTNSSLEESIVAEEALYDNDIENIMFAFCLCVCHCSALQKLRE